MTTGGGSSPRPRRPLGLSDLARLLSTEDRPVSRQMVYQWAMRRTRNGFPAPVPWVGHGRRYDPDQVIAWYRAYVPSHGGRPRKPTPQNVFTPGSEAR
jgi:hypothetical protein